MDVIVEDEDGHRRNIVLSWHRKEASDTPPANWVEQVQGEVSLQRTEEKAKEKGTWVPAP
jgi:hypothetical protein